MIRECFDELWDSISNLQGEEFKTASGENFKFSVEENPVGISLQGKQVDQYIGESSLFRAYTYMSQHMVATPEDMESVAIHRGDSEIEGSTYIWSIFNDQRVLV